MRRDRRIPETGAVKIMEDEVKYYLVLGPGRTQDNPSGLARRTFTKDGRLDESLTRDLSWRRSSEIYEWERGEELGADLVEISEGQAAAVIQRFRENWDKG
jgi:hypothetical protein